MIVSPVRDICYIFRAFAIFIWLPSNVAKAFLTSVNYQLTTEVNSHPPQTALSWFFWGNSLLLLHTVSNENHKL